MHRQAALILKALRILSEIDSVFSVNIRKVFRWMFWRRLYMELFYCLPNSAEWLTHFRTSVFWVITRRNLGNFLPRFRDNLSVPSSEFKNPKQNYRQSPRHDPEERGLQPFRGRNLKITHAFSFSKNKVWKLSSGNLNWKARNLVVLFQTIFLNYLTLRMNTLRLFVRSVTIRPMKNPRIIKLLAPELFFLILAHPVYKMWIIQVKWNSNLMQHCAGFISAESLYMFRAQAPIIRSI